MNGNYKFVWMALVLLVLVGVYYFFDPSSSSYFLSCPIKTFTGYDCPGCGSQRAFHALLHFRFLEAFKQNPLFVIFVGLGIIKLLFVVVNLDRKYPLIREFYQQKVVFVIIITIFFLFLVLRNMDFYHNAISRF